MNNIITNMYTGVIAFEGSNCNPNGDPDNEGSPRADPDTGHGRMSPQATSRRIYDRVAAMFVGQPGYALQIQRGTSIEASIIVAAKDADIAPSKKLKSEERTKVTDAVCRRYFDTRMGGGVLNVGSCPTDGVNGVCTFAWGKSIYPVTILQDTLTRVSPTNEAQEKDREMGRRYVIAHGVYRQSFFVNPHHAARNGATVADLAIYLNSLANIWEFKRSVMSGMISMRGIWLFRHDSKFGNAAAHTLIDRVQISSDKDDPRAWSDYDLQFDASNLPAGIKVFTLEDMLGGHEALAAKLSE